MEGEYSMNHYDGMYGNEVQEYHTSHNDNSPIILLFFILFCSLSINFLKYCGTNEVEETPISIPLLLEKKEITNETLFDEICSICLEQFQKEEKVTTLQCDHTFHFDCMVLWTKNKDTCPLCRGTILIT